MTYYARSYLWALGRRYAGLFFRLQTEIVFTFKLVFTPQSEEIEPAVLGMSLNTLGEVSSTQTSFPLLDIRSCENSD